MKSVFSYKLLFILILAILCACATTNDDVNSIHPELLRDRDALLDRLEQLDDFEGVTYTQEQLAELSTIGESRNYKQVIVRFADEVLGQKIDSFQTISLDEVFRTVAVVTMEGRVYRVSLKKLDEYNGIFVVDMYGELIWKVAPEGGK